MAWLRNLVVFYIFVGTVMTFIAYDCTDSRVNISVISIKDVAACPDIHTGYLEKRGKVTVLQKDNIAETHVKTCLIEISRLITHCGMHSHSSVVKGGLYSYIQQIGSDVCLDIHRFKTYSILGRVINNVVMNGTTSSTMTLAGSVNSEGRCEGGSYYEPDNEWNNVVVTATIKITTRDYLAPVKLLENEVSILGGLTCPYAKGHCFDSTFGETVWELNNRKTCSEDLTVLFEGEGQWITEKLEGNKITGRYVVIEQESRIFALTLVEKHEICGFTTWRTEHPQIIIVTEDDNFRNVRIKSHSPEENIDLMVYVNSKFLYVEQSYKRAIHHLYRDTIHRRCLLKRDILINRLTLAPLTPSAVGLLLKKEVGYIGRVLGEVLYVIKCIPKNAEIRRINRCFNELPITVDNKSYYMSAITRIIQNHAEEIECSPLTPPLYRVDGHWIGLSPNPIISDPPSVLEVDSETTIRFSPIQPISTSGLYTVEEINKAQRSLTFGVERQAVENIITRRVAGFEVSNQGYSTLNIFEPAEMEKLAKSTLRKIWGWFTDVGIFFSGVMGIYMIFKCIQYFVGIILNGVHLYKIFGWSLALIASIWNTLTMWLVHRHYVKEDRERHSHSTVIEVGTNELTSGGVNRLYPDVHWTENANISSAPSAKV